MVLATGSEHSSRSNAPYRPVTNGLFIASALWTQKKEEWICAKLWKKSQRRTSNFKPAVFIHYHFAADSDTQGSEKSFKKP